MTSLTRTVASLPRRPLIVFLLVAAVVLGSRVTTASIDLVEAVLMPAAAIDDARDDTATGADTATTDPLAPLGAPGDVAELERIRANVTFWGDRSRAAPRDFISATRFAASSIDLARATGDLTRYEAAEAAIGDALAIDPDYAPARGLRGIVLVALHRFSEARDLALATLRDSPADPVALATLGDATLELGDLTTAAGAYEQLALVADGAATQVRVSRLAFIDGRTEAAVDASRAAAASAEAEASSGPTLAWYRYQLADTLLATGDPDGAEAAVAAALAADPAFPLALAARARLAAADGRLDDAIADLDRAIAVIPLPDMLARRADLYERRAGPGDDRRASTDRATILAIADLAGPAAGVYDRTLSVYLATTGLDPARALRLAEDELAVRTDVYGYDAYGWALLAAGRPAEADVALTTALAVGTRDARLLVHAGLAAAAVGDAPRARALLADGLALDPTFDPSVVDRARTTLATLP